MLNPPPLVSVIIPVYNAEPYVAEAIESVLAQSYNHIEIIAVDDGSTDNSAAVVKRFPAVHYYTQPNAGISATRNRGIKQAQGDFLAFLDADDVWVKEKLALQLAAFEENAHLDVVFGHVKQFRSPELKTVPNNKPSTVEPLMPGHIPSTMLIKRDAFFRVGLFETNWKMGEFASWYLRSLEQGLQHIMLPDLVARRRVHETNNGIQQRTSIHDYVHIIKASLDRRRAAALKREENKKHS
ncbi:MAG: glycosyltransferase family 2 protein [Anaerolineae bacterium]|nr:glycosyltransferase family 2 protein [Anaerolineae bacterium]